MVRLVPKRSIGASSVGLRWVANKPFCNWGCQHRFQSGWVRCLMSRFYSEPITLRWSKRWPMAAIGYLKAPITRLDILSIVGTPVPPGNHLKFSLRAADCLRLHLQLLSIFSEPPTFRNLWTHPVSLCCTFVSRRMSNTLEKNYKSHFRALLLPLPRLSLWPDTEGCQYHVTVSVEKGCSIRSRLQFFIYLYCILLHP